MSPALALLPTLDAIEAEPEKLRGLPFEVVVDLLVRVDHLRAELHGESLRRPARRAADPTAAPPPADDWITEAEAARQLGCSEKWFRRRRRQLPFVTQLSPRKWRVSKSGLAKWVVTRRA